MLFLMLAGLLLRSPLLRSVIGSRVAKFNAAWHADLAIRRAGFRGISTVYLAGITLRPAGGDSLLRIDTLLVTVNPWKLLAGRLSITAVDVRRIAITMKRQERETNYMFLLSKSGGEAASDTASTSPVMMTDQDYAAVVSRLSRLIFDLVPHEVSISNLDLLVRADGHRVRFHLAELALRDHYFHLPLDVEEDSVRAQWIVAGRLDYHTNTVAFRIYSQDTSAVSIPYIDFRWQAKVKFDTLAFSLSETDGDNGRASITGFVLLRGLAIDQERISEGPVTFDKLATDYTINIGSDYAELDSSTTVTFNRIDLHPYFRYRPKPTKQITLRIHKPEFPAQDLFESLPPALFSTLQGIRVKGSLSWFLDFFVDLSQPDSLEFATDLVRHQFSVVSYGNADLTRINTPFAYTAYEHGAPVRTFEVGPGNPNYRPIDRISPFLKSAVLTSEDGGLYLHRGFLADAFRESIIANIKAHSFVRGGSTISMQLVKNVYLNRNKTIARKLEEALIVWLIENQGLSSKERMFEVYLNIIEWGPMVYGAGEASRFYFNKEPSRLTLAEAIYLASIIPRPKWFRYSFDETGHLKASNAGFYQLVSGKMLSKGWITSRDADRLVPDVELKGAARALLNRQDRSLGDSSEVVTR